MTCPGYYINIIYYTDCNFKAMAAALGGLIIYFWGYFPMSKRLNVNKKAKRIASRRRLIILALVIILGIAIPLALAGDTELPIAAGGEIVAVEMLPIDVAEQIVPTGTTLEELNLPAFITAHLLGAQLEGGPSNGGNNAYAA